MPSASLSMTDRAREQRARRALAHDDMILRKSRTDGVVYVNGTPVGQSIDNYGGYMLLNGNRLIIRGERFDLSLDDVEAYLSG